MYLSPMSRRCAVVLGAAMAIFHSVGVRAASFPDRPIKVIIGFAAGGPLDQHMRLLTDRLQKELGQPIIVDYRAGAGGTIGADAVAKSSPDGYTLMLANTGVLSINGALYKKLPFDLKKDFVPVARTALQPLALMVNNNVPAKTLREFLSYAKSHPKDINFGSGGNGGISHLVPEMLNTVGGLSMRHIPYKGSAPAFNDLISGQVQFMAESVPQAATFAKQGLLRALAVTSRERNTALPDVPTTNEAGLPNFEVVGFYGIMAPAATPRDVVEKLSKAFGAVLKQPDLRERMVSQGADPAYLNSEDFRRFLFAETPRWERAVREAGASID